ncbi:coiled-coil domain-containing protein 181-like [Asterias rubens]|uniref:coiled-coil domain-containing protein 181-like n=1 Tax=Asterias rubens TaxID=7604 RepID=UPI0014554AE5|nr:coiled-coil domain-containing protein 181-like [Asterias rubens]
MAGVETANEPAQHDMERTDSMSSIDKEIDLLMRDGETEDTATDSQEGGQDERYSRSESRREEPASQYPLNEESTERHETVIGNEEYEHETASDDELSDEQKLLELELQKLKDEGFLPMDDPPEYDIASRVRELNEQLRAEGEIPERTDRKVTFSEKVIAVEFHDDEEDFETEPDVENDNTASENVDSEAAPSSEVVTDPNDIEVAKLTLDDEEKASEIETKDSDNQRSSKSNGQSPRGPDEKILIERDGKFELINVKDLSYDERQSMGLEVLPDETDQRKKDPVTPNGHGDAPIPEETTPHETTNQLQPTPPSKPRPSTATDNTGLHRTQLPPRRIQSARTQRESTTSWSVTYTGHSKYGLTPEQKEHKKEQLRARMQKEQEERKAAEEEQRKKQEEAESAFQAWLQNKQDSQKQRRQSEKDQKRHGGEKDQGNTDDNYQDWLQMKQSQAKRERKLRKQAEQEKVNGFYIRDRKDCDQAFKQWVRSKNDQLRKERSLKRSNASISKQLAQQSRKSKNLAKALETAQIYRYTDWYGYRF